MLPCLSVSHQRETKTKRIALRRGFVGLSFFAVVGSSLLQRRQAAENILTERQVPAASTKIQPKLVASYRKLPLSFEANQGRMRGPAQSLWGGRGYTLFLTGQEAVRALRRAAAGSWKPEVEGSERCSGRRIPPQRGCWRGEMAT